MPMRVEREIARARRAHERWTTVAAGSAAELAACPGRSRWSVAEHLHHALLAEREILARVAQLASEPETTRGGGPTLAGHVVLALRRIPRGRGKSPERVLPEKAPSLDALQELLAQNARVLDELEGISPALAAARGRERHAVLGGLDAAQWLRYVSIHDEHHLRIVGASARLATSAPNAPRARYSSPHDR